MGKVQLSIDQLEGICDQGINSFASGQPLLSAIFELLKNTGLRIGEALHTENWTEIDAIPESYNVQLEKGEAVRNIARDLVPDMLRTYYDNHRDLGFYTYSACEYSLSRAIPRVISNSDSKRTTTHLYRYYFIKKLHADGLTDQEIQNVIKHASLASTRRYIYDPLYLIT